MNKTILKLSLAAFLTSNLFAYTDFDTFGDKSITKSNSTNIAFKYYQTGISDTMLVLKDELKKSSLYHSSFDVKDKFIVYIDVSKKSLEEIIFFRAVSQKTNLLESYLVNSKNKNNKFVLFGIYDNEIDANFALGKINEYNIPAEKKFITNQTFTYDDLILQRIDEGLGNYSKKIPVKLMVVKEKVYIDSKNNEYSTKNIVDNDLNKSKENIIDSNSKKEISKTKNTKKDKKVIDIKKNNEKNCLIRTIYNIRSYGLFNNKSLKFKYKGKIYSKGDSFTDDISKCSYTITDIYTKHPANLVIQFNDYVNDKLVARLQTLQDNFVSLSDLFYDFEKDLKNDNLIIENKESQTSNIKTNTVADNKQQEITKDANIVSDNKQQDVAKKDVKDIQEARTLQNTQTISINSNKKICNFDALSGIRTYLVKENDKYVKKPVITYYQGKQLEVNFYPQEDDTVIISSPNSSEMKITKKDFEKNCK